MSNNHGGPAAPDDENIARTFRGGVDGLSVARFLGKSRSHIGRALAFIAAYVVAGVVSIELGFLAVDILPLWLPAGVAVTLGLRFGYSAALIVSPGALILGWIMPAEGMQLPNNMLIPLLLVLAGARLRGRADAGPPPMDTASILRYLVIGGPLASAITSLLIVVPFLSELTTIGPYRLWLQWWLACTLGVLLVLPVGLLWMQAGPQGARRRLLYSAPILMGFLLWIAVRAYVIDAERRQGDADFQRLAASTVAAMEKTLTGYHDVLYLLSDFVMIHRPDWNEFSAISKNFLTRQPRGIQALEWIPVVAHEERARFEESMTRELGRPYRIYDLVDGRRIASAPAEDYLPIAYAYPLKGNEPALGFNLAAAPHTRWARERAQDFDLAAATPGIRLVQENAAQRAIVIYVPVYETGVTTALVKQRRAALAGYVAGVFRLGDLVDTLLEDVKVGGLFRLQLVDLDVVPDRVLYDSNPESESIAPVWSQPFYIAEHYWRANLSPGPEWTVPRLVATGDAVSGWTIVVLGTLAQLLLMYAGRTAEVERQVTERTRELADEVIERRRIEERLRIDEERFRSLAEQGGFVPWEAEHTPWRFLYIGPQCVTLLGVRQPLWLSPGFYEMVLHPDDRQRVLAQARTQARAGIPYTSEYRLLRPDGCEVWIYDIVHTSVDQAGNPVLRGFMIDITQRQKDRENLRLAASVFQSTHDAIAVLDDNGKIITANNALSTITGFSTERLIGRSIDLLLATRAGSPSHDDIWTAMEKTGKWSGEVWNRTREGRTYPSWFSLTRIGDGTNGRPHHVCVFADISPLKAAHERMEYLAHHDPLTGLPNRARFHEALHNAATGVGVTHKGIALFFIDLDRFKHVNDTLGHNAGDALLQAVATRLRQRIRSADVLCRIGGDEFTLLVADVAGRKYAGAIATKLLGAFESPFEILGNAIQIGASIGVALTTEIGYDAARLLREADSAMYLAKETEGPSCAFSGDRVQPGVTPSVCGGRASEFGNLELYYQPQVRLPGGVCMALQVRPYWDRAEASGYSVDVDRITLEQTCHQLARWCRQGLSPPPVAIPVGPERLIEPQLAEDVKRLLATFDLAPALLEIQIYEATLLDNPEGAAEALRALSEIGVGLTLDAFGTGYSNLRYIKRLALSKLKIDQGLMRDLVGDDDIAAMIRALIGIGHQLGADVVAQGVETTRQLAFLVRNRCDAAQGDLLSPPIPATEAQVRLEEATRLGRRVAWAIPELT